MGNEVKIGSKPSNAEVPNGFKQIARNLYEKTQGFCKPPQFVIFRGVVKKGDETTPQQLYNRMIKGVKIPSKQVGTEVVQQWKFQPWSPAPPYLPGGMRLVQEEVPIMDKVVKPNTVKLEVFGWSQDALSVAICGEKNNNALKKAK